jgi:hypothetical protein
MATRKSRRSTRPEPPAAGSAWNGRGVEYSISVREGTANQLLAGSWNDSISGGTRVAELAFGQDTPQLKIEDALAKSRYWTINNWFVPVILGLRYVFFNYDLAIKAVNKSDQGKIGTWLAKDDGRVEREVRRYARDAWMEFLSVDNVACAWRRSTGKPICYPAEKTQFSDDLGEEVLIIRLKLSSDQIRAMQGLTDKERLRLKQNGGNLTLRHGDPDFEFDVARRERAGRGYAWPRLATIFTTCAQNESMEVGDNLIAAMGRLVYEQHKLGHEIKSGLHAGSPQHFYNDKKGKALEKNLKGSVGHVRLATNFDHDITFPRMDPKYFDAKKFESVVRRLALWSMPLGQMILEKGLNPYLMDIFGKQAEEAREYMAEHLPVVYRGAMKAPAAVKVEWSAKCFRDSRLAADLMKSALAGGPASQTSFQRFVGLDPEAERALKQEESELPEAQTFPLYDPSHGAPDKAAGRKRGTADRQATK